MEEAERNGEARGKNRIRASQKRGASENGGTPPFLRLYGFLLFPWSSWLGGRFALHPVAEIGGFVTVKENK